MIEVIGSNALLLAAYQGHNNTIDHLLTKYSDQVSLNDRDNYGSNALFFLILEATHQQ